VQVLVKERIIHWTSINFIHQWCNYLRARLECSRSWVRASTMKNPTKHGGLVQSGPHHHLIEN